MLKEFEMADQKPKFKISREMRDALIEEVLDVIYDEKEKIIPDPEFDYKQARVTFITSIASSTDIKECSNLYKKLYEESYAPKFLDVYNDIHLRKTADREKKREHALLVATAFIKAMCGHTTSTATRAFRKSRGSITIPSSDFIFYTLCGIVLPKIDVEIATILGNFSKLECQDCLKTIAQNHNFGPYAKEPIEETEEAEKTEDEFDVSDYESEILRLEEELRRAKQQIRDMSEGYESQFEDNVLNDKAQFIAKLNSDSYNNILDMTVSLREGIKHLRTNGKSLPMEINILPIILSQFMKFLKDNGITPIIQRTGEIIEITGDDLDKYVYNGSPFSNIKEKKRVKILTNGWKNEALDTNISLPRVEEII